ncbi:zinc finger protein 474-like [Selaginella moellendorffii]|uniref:zinc finger protein 474-like n=1 Tax=Selaginella moellendorffii TaxID=88036 RepID=UPI000D1D0266|nr:zinc finger protein 474-like [Selaginella moellendorffii]|eukprot:XP_024536139.1 zinc finger protein 474-like [Selaginella moellendorffii]
MDIAVGGNMAARPKMLMCYLCGREYGTKSLPIHIPQCQKKWLAEEELKPPKERRPLPLPPAEIPIATSSGGYNVDAFNDAAYAQWEGNLEQCPHCDRKFRPEAFKHHQKSCTALRPAKKAGTGLTAAALSNRLPPGLVQRGARRFFQNRLLDHLPLGLRD